MENNGVEKSAGLTSSGSPCEADKALAKLVADEVVHAIDAKWGGLFAKLATIPRIRTAADNARRDVSLLLNRSELDLGAIRTGFEASTLKGGKKRQFLALCEMKKTNPKASLRGCAKAAIEANPCDDGYAYLAGLIEYAATHRSWWQVSGEADAEAAKREGGEV